MTAVNIAIAGPPAEPADRVLAAQEKGTLWEADSKRPRNTNEGCTNTTRHAQEPRFVTTAWFAPPHSQCKTRVGPKNVRAEVENT
jgi:hypothetical protein